MDDQSSVKIEDRGSHRKIVLNRPHKANSINRATLAALADAIDDTSKREDIRLLEITGAGDRVFCAGADLSEAGNETASAELARSYDQKWDGLTSNIEQLPCLTIANINGACIGGGLSIALACDLRIAVKTATFSYPAAKHGFMPSPDDVARIIQLIGRSGAKRLLMVGQRFSSEDAARMGLIDLPLTTPEDVIGQILESLENGSSLSSLAIKRLIDDRERGQWLIADCYSAVYERRADAISVLRGRST
jgi:enoyl-CoA hydratase/carnithine racemase